MGVATSETERVRHAVLDLAAHGHAACTSPRVSLRRALPLLGLLLSFVSCDSTASEDDFGPPPPVKSRLALLERLGRPARFLIGHGNDLPDGDASFSFDRAGIYSLPATLDIHYVYLSGLPRETTAEGGPGWPDYNPDGAFVTHVAETAVARGVVPMFTLYQAATRGELRLDVLRDPDFMGKYWDGVRLLLDKLRALDRPAMIHVEPDFWGYVQRAARSGAPAEVPVVVGAAVPECRDLPEDVSGMGRCIVRLTRQRAPKVTLGFHASGFGALDRPKRVAKFLTDCGALETDFIVLETLDRDAGCFEQGIDPRCGRSEYAPYWDETNTRSPNFAEHVAWVSTIHERLGLPVLWWQMPLGVPSDKPGGAPKRYRDNRVRYLFAHPEAFEAAGGFGAAFGVGAPNQTDITTDDGQFARAVTQYYARPLPITRP